MDISFSRFEKVYSLILLKIFSVLSSWYSFSSMPIICRLGFNLKDRPSWCPKALPCSLHILKKKFSLNSIEWSLPCLLALSLFSKWPVLLERLPLRFLFGLLGFYFPALFQFGFSSATLSLTGIQFLCLGSMSLSHSTLCFSLWVVWT